MAYVKDTSYIMGARMLKTGTWYLAFNEFPSAWVNRISIQRTRTGESNPRYKDQIRLQQNATTAMTGVVDNVDSTPGRFFIRSSRNWPVNDACWPPGTPGFDWRCEVSGDVALYHAVRPNWTTLNPSVAYNRALSSYLKKARAQQVAFSAPTFLGELRQTLDMIRRPAQGLANLAKSYLDDVKRLKKRRPKDWKKNLSSTWLEQAFGWQPLMADIKNAVNAYRQSLDNKEQTPVSSYGVHESDQPLKCLRNENIIAYAGSGAPNLWRDRKAFDRAVVVFRGMVRRNVSGVPWQSPALFGFSPLEFLPTAWELMPWSFLIDYFTNIGDIVETAVFNQSDLIWTNISTIVFQITEDQVRIRPTQSPACGFQFGGESSSVKWTRRTVSRVAGAGNLGLPTFSFELPGRPAQWANMTALFAQASHIHPQRHK